MIATRASRAHHLLRSTGGRAALALIGTFVFGMLFIGSYVGALHDPRPRAIPLGVVAPPALTTRLSEALPGFRLRAEPSVGAARTAVEKQDLDGALVFSRDGVRLFTSSAASVQVALTLERTGRALAARERVPLSVQDLRPLPKGDSRGLSPFYLALGWVVAGYLGATLLGILSPLGGRSRRAVGAHIGALGAFAVAVGVGGALISDPILGALGGHFAALAGLGALVVAASALSTLGMQSLLGLGGTALVLVAYVALGNPASGGPAAPGLLPSFWRALGPVLPPGAGTDAVRGAVYFGGSGIGGALLVLTLYTLFGAALALAVGGRQSPLSVAALTGEARQVRSQDPY